MGDEMTFGEGRGRAPELTQHRSPRPKFRAGSADEHQAQADDRQRYNGGLRNGDGFETDIEFLDAV